jgi:CBS domain-containing protein
MGQTALAKDIMNTNVITISQNETLGEAIKKLVQNKISGMPVLDDSKKMVGIISEKDILNFAFCGHLKDTKVSEAMSTKVVSYTPDSLIDSITLAISQKHFRRVPIVKNNIVVGIISRRDIIRYVLDI